MQKVLIVDDEELIRNSIVKMIDWEAMDLVCVGCCSNGVEAMELITEETPDIIITDIKMPVLDGLELVSQAKKMYPLIQSIVLSGFAEFDLAREAISKGVQEYLLKPCSKEALRTALDKCCNAIKQQERESGNTVIRKQQINQLEEKIDRVQSETGTLSRETLEQLCSGIEDLSVLREVGTRLLTRCDLTQNLWILLQKLYKIQNDRACLLDLLGEILPQIACQENPENYIAIIINYVNTHFDEADLTLQMLADNVIYMNVKYVGKQFFQFTGLRFREYLSKVRMERAKALLAVTPEIKISSIAEQTGFGNNVQYFYQVFKKYEGMTPEKYRLKTCPGEYETNENSARVGD